MTRGKLQFKRPTKGQKPDDPKEPGWHWVRVYEQDGSVTDHPMPFSGVAAFRSSVIAFEHCHAEYLGVSDENGEVRQTQNDSREEEEQ